jgi:hypothetical protein
MKRNKYYFVKTTVEVMSVFGGLSFLQMTVM